MMKKKSIILLFSGIIGLLGCSAFALSTIIPSYNEWKENYDAVIEENAKAKYTTIEGVTISDVTLEKIGFKPYYSISGYYDETVNPNSISFKLYTYDNRVNYAEIIRKDVDTKNKTFKISADISMVSCDGDGNEMYNHNDNESVKLLDSIERHALYPKLVIGDFEEEITNLNDIWTNKTLEFGNCKYEIKINSDNDVFPYAMPALLKTTSEEISPNATYAATGVEFVRYDNDICYVLNGTSSGYSRDTLSKMITFEMRAITSTETIFAIRGTQGGPLVMENNGDWKLYVRVNDIPATGDYPYFTRFGQNIDAKGNICDLKVPGLNGTSDGDYFIVGNKKYTIYINHGTRKVDAYGTTGLKVEVI